MKNGISVFADGVIVRNKNRRIVIRKHKRLVGAVFIEMYSVNKDNGVKGNKGHVYTQYRLNRRVTSFGLSHEALLDIFHAIEIYNERIEQITSETWVYK